MNKITALIKEHGFLPDDDLIEFAEIIIKECINEIEDLRNIDSDVMSSKGYKHWDTYSGVLDDAKNKIKKHFGIDHER